jgi:hypothetical protein
MVRVQQDGLDEGSFLFLELTEILRGDDASGDQTVRLCEQRGLQTIRHEPWSFLLDVDRFAADAVVELDCGCGCCGICSWMRNDFHQRHEMGRVEWVADEDALGVLALADELRARDAGGGGSYYDVFACFCIDLREELQF